MTWKQTRVLAAGRASRDARLTRIARAGRPPQFAEFRREADDADGGAPVRILTPDGLLLEEVSASEFRRRRRHSTKKGTS